MENMPETPLFVSWYDAPVPYSPYHTDEEDQGDPESPLNPSLEKSDRLQGSCGFSDNLALGALCEAAKEEAANAVNAVSAADETLKTFAELKVIYSQFCLINNADK